MLLFICFEPNLAHLMEEFWINTCNIFFYQECMQVGMGWKEAILVILFFVLVLCNVSKTGRKNNAFSYENKWWHSIQYMTWCVLCIYDIVCNILESVIKEFLPKLSWMVKVHVLLEKIFFYYNPIINCQHFWNSIYYEIKFEIMNLEVLQLKILKD